jgi:hypothetical protein
MNVEVGSCSFGVEKSELYVSEKSSVVGADAVQPAASAVIAWVGNRVLKVVLLVEDGNSLCTDTARCASERRLNGDDAVCLTVAANIILVVHVMPDGKCGTYKQLQIKSFRSWTIALRQISLRITGGSSMIPFCLRQENRWPFFKWMSI